MGLTHSELLPGFDDSATYQVGDSRALKVSEGFQSPHEGALPGRSSKSEVGLAAGTLLLHGWDRRAGGVTAAAEAGSRGVLSATDHWADARRTGRSSGQTGSGLSNSRRRCPAIVRHNSPPTTPSRGITTRDE